MLACIVAHAQESSTTSIAESASPSVVQIFTYDATGSVRGQGSGFFIAPCTILTNAHVIAKAYSAAVSSEDTVYSSVTLLKSDEDADLALVAVAGNGEPALSLGDDALIRPGQHVVAIGNPMGLERSVSDGMISAIRSVPGYAGRLIQTTAPISPGSSGGPLLADDGLVIGVTAVTLDEGQNLNFAVGPAAIKSFLNRPDFPKALRPAKSRVLGRVILKWLGVVALGLIGIVGALLGGGWWILMIVGIVLFSVIGWLVKKLRGLFVAIFQRKPKPRTGIPQSEGFFCWHCGAHVDASEDGSTGHVTCPGCGTVLATPTG
jgi:S1-C subfamily serine protease